MKPLVIQLLEVRGLKISENTYKEKEELFDFINEQKSILNKADLGESNIGLKTIAGGDHIE